MAFSEDTCMKKERVRSKLTPKKFGLRLKRRRELNKERLVWKLAWLGSSEKKEATFSRIERKTSILRPALQLNQSFLCGFRRIKGRGGGVPNGQSISVKIAADRRSQRSSKIIDEKREKYRAKNGSLRNASTDSNGTTFVNLINQRKRANQKGKIESNEQGKKEAEVILWKRAGCQTKSKAFEKSIVERIV